MGFYYFKVKNPPELCFGLPYLKYGAKLCLKFHDLDWKNDTFSGCVDLIGYLFDIKIGTVGIGCFKSIKMHQFEYYEKITFIKSINMSLMSEQERVKINSNYF